MCERKRLTAADMHQTARQFGGEFLSREYLGAAVKVREGTVLVLFVFGARARERRGRRRRCGPGRELGRCARGGVHTAVAAAAKAAAIADPQM